MHKFKKKIPVFSLWLACIAIVVHMIIPHDHHLSDSSACQDESCPVSDNTPGHKTGFPIHCHALHDLTSEKAVIYQIISLVHQEYFITVNSSASSETHILISDESTINRKEPLSEIYLLEYSSLRAPPSIS
jgi:hypothetical protein